MPANHCDHITMATSTPISHFVAHLSSSSSMRPRTPLAINPKELLQK